MALVPENIPLLHLMNEVDSKPEFPRDYLGLSQIGGSCYRALQYYHYWAYKVSFPNRIQRLFDDGHRSEDILIDALVKAGIVSFGMQEEIIGTAGHWKGHIDAEGYDVDAPQEIFLQEFKSHNDKNFKLVKKLGVKKFSSTHYGQIQAYMGYRGLPRCLYSAYNKNDSEIWSTWVEFDCDYYNELVRKESEVIASDILLPRIGNGTPAWFECKFCDAKKVCFGRDKVEKSCRSCKYVDVLDEGKWYCSNHCNDLSTDDQKAACDLYELGDMFHE